VAYIKKTDWIDSDIVLADDFNKIEQGVYDALNAAAGTGAIQNPAIGLGLNRIQITEVPVSPKIALTGMAYTNLLGKDGNCEDVSKWFFSNVTLALDSANKVFGVNGIKHTLTNTSSYMWYLPKIDVSKYYMLSAFFKVGNCTSIAVYKDTTGGGTFVGSVGITDNTKFVRAMCKASPSTLNINNLFAITCNGTVGQYGYVDGIMLNEISATDYALTDAQLLAKYPYVDSYAALTNPYFENRRYNLVRNGNGEEGIGYWKCATVGTITIENGKFKTSTSGDTKAVWQTVKVKPNTNYYISANIAAGTATGNIFVFEKDSIAVTLRNGIGTFNTGNRTEIDIACYFNTVGYIYVDSIMLVEGTVAPTAYLSQDIQRFVVEGQFTSDDKLVVENGRVSGLLNWKHKTLFGKDYEWGSDSDYIGYKEIACTISPIPQIEVSEIGIKYEGKVLKTLGDGLNSSAADVIKYHSNGNIYISVADSDTGWAETINPSNDEIKAFMNGWKAVYNNGIRQTGWLSITDGTVPNGAIQATTAATTNTTTITVSSGGTNFVSGDSVYTVNPITGLARSSGSVTGVPTATNIPVAAAINIISGDILVRGDNGYASVPLLTWCKNNVAPNYEGYRLHYRLANPEPITDINTHVHGEIWDLVKGDNYVYVDSGIVLGEVGSATYYVNTNVYAINYANVYASSATKNKPDSFYAVYKNSIYDNAWILRSNYDAGSPLTKADAFVSNALFDPTATYTVDYQILKTLHAQSFGSLAMSYAQSILATLEDHSKSLEQKQMQDSALDTLVDLSMYETQAISGFPCLPNHHTDGRIYVTFNIKFSAYKKCIPRVTITKLEIYASGANVAGVNCTQLMIPYGITVTQDKMQAIYYTYDAATIAAIKANGAFGNMSIKADCGGRI